MTLNTSHIPFPISMNQRSSMKKAKISILVLGFLLIPAHETNAIFDYFTRDGVIKFSAVVSALTFTLVVGREIKKYFYPQEAELNVTPTLTEAQLKKIIKTESNSQLIQAQLAELLTTQRAMQGQLDAMNYKLLTQSGGVSAAVLTAPPSYKSDTTGFQTQRPSLASTGGHRPLGAAAASGSHPSSPTPSVTDAAVGTVIEPGGLRRSPSTESGIGSFAVVRAEEAAASHHDQI